MFYSLFFLYPALFQDTNVWAIPLLLAWCKNKKHFLALRSWTLPSSWRGGTMENNYPWTSLCGCNELLFEDRTLQERKWCPLHFPQHKQEAQEETLSWKITWKKQHINMPTLYAWPGTFLTHTHSYITLCIQCMASLCLTLLSPFAIVAGHFVQARKSFQIDSNTFKSLLMRFERVVTCHVVWFGGTIGPWVFLDGCLTVSIWSCRLWSEAFAHLRFQAKQKRACYLVGQGRSLSLVCRGHKGKQAMSFAGLPHGEQSSFRKRGKRSFENLRAPSGWHFLNVQQQDGPYRHWMPQIWQIAVPLVGLGRPSWPSCFMRFSH